METETARLFLRPFTSQDLDTLCQLYSDPDVMRYIGKGVRNRDESEQSLSKMIAHWQSHGLGMWAAFHKPDGRFVGRCGLTPLADTEQIELGYTFHRDFWGQGLATEAARRSLQHGFETLGLSRIVAIARPANVASWRVMEKVGMTRERIGVSPYDDTEVVWYALARADHQRRRKQFPDSFNE
jgi:ribosomal-protein-alanine N-acetyltransferase